MKSTKILIALMTIALVACTPDAPVEEAPVGEIIATVNNSPITSAQFDVYARRRGDTPQTDEARRALVEDLVNLELLVQQAMRDDMHRDPEIAGEITVQRNAMLAQAAIFKFLEDNPVSEDELRAEYGNYSAMTERDELRASHILVEEESLARELITAIEGGTEFEVLAGEHSLDGSGARGGDLGWFDPAMMVTPFADAVTAMEIGQVSDTPVQSRFGWHVIKLVDRRESTPAPFEEVRDEIRNYLQGQKVEAWVEEMRASATIEVK